MKAVALLVLLVALAFIPESDAGWFRRTIRKVGRAIRKVVRVVRKGIDIYKKYRKFIPIRGKRDAVSEDEFLDNLATRDISELVDVSKMTDAEVAELLTAQRHTREVMDELEAIDSQEQH